MSIHIAKFVDRIKSFEARQIRDFTMTMQEAKDLHADITKLLLQLQQAREDTSPVDQTIDIEIRAPKF